MSDKTWHTVGNILEPITNPFGRTDKVGKALGLGDKAIETLKSPLVSFFEQYAAKQAKDNANADLPPEIGATVDDIGKAKVDPIETQAAKRRISRLAKYYTSANGVFSDASTGTTGASGL